MGGLSCQLFVPQMQRTKWWKCKNMQQARGRGGGRETDWQLDCQTDDKLEINLTITSKWTRRQSTCEWVFCANWNTAVCDTCTAGGRMKEEGTDKQKGMQTNLLLATGNWQLANTQCAQHAIKYAAKHQSKAKSSRATRNCKRCALVSVPCVCVWHCICVATCSCKCVCGCGCVYGQCASSFAAR